MLFKYKAQLSDGTIVEDKEEASDQFDLVKKMKTVGRTVIFAKEIHKKRFFLLGYLNGLLARVSLKDKLFFTRNLGVMLGAGLPLVRSLSVLGRQTSNAKFKSVLASLEESVTKGNSLNESLALFPNVFSPLMIAMVKSGEASGTLTESLQIVARHLEESYLLQRRVYGALMYPAVIILAMIVIGIALMVYVMPTLTSTFIDLGVSLPPTTKAIIFLSDTLRTHGFLFIGVFLLISFLIFLILQSESGKRLLDSLFLRTPIVKGFVIKMNSARVSRTLSSLLSSGVNMLEAVSIAEDVAQNKRYKDALRQAKEKIQKGVALSEVFFEHKALFPVLVDEMISVGEETGKLASMLSEIAQFYEGEIEQSTKNFGTIIEPVLMIVIGAAVGFFAYAVITPLYSVLEVI